MQKTKEAKENGADLPIDAEDKVTLGSEDIKVEGTWSFKANPKTVNVIYDYDIQSTEKLPDELMDELKSFNEAGRNKKIGDVVTAQTPKQTVVDVNGGKLVFKGWYEKDEEPVLNKTVEMGNEDKKLFGLWVFEANSTPGGGETPEPGGPDGGGSTDKPGPTPGGEIENPDTSTPDGGKETPVDDQVFVEFIFKSSTEGKKVLPNEVEARTPSNQKGKRNETFDLNVVQTFDETFEDEFGTWSFDKWDHENNFVLDKNEKVIGYWSFKPADEKTGVVKFEFVSDGKTQLPDDFKKPNETEKPAVIGKSVTTPTNTEDVTLDHGTWSFVGWKVKDSQATAGKLASVPVNKDEVTYVGVWTFTKAPDVPEEAKVTFTFKSLNGDPLPAEIEEPNKKEVTSHIGSKEGTPTNVVDVTVDGKTWKFKGWKLVESNDNPVAYTSVPVTSKETNYEGIWELVDPDAEVVEAENATVHFTFKKEDESIEGDLGSPDRTDVTSKVGEVVPTPTNTNAKELENGSWVFVGWKKADTDYPPVATTEVGVVATDVTYDGIWRFEPKQTPAKDATVHFAFMAANGKELPKGIILPDHDKTRTGAEGSVIETPNVGDEKEIDGTVWVFKGWKRKDSNDEPASMPNVVVDQNELLNHYDGIWDEKPVKKYSVGFVFTTDDGVVLPDEIRKLKPLNQLNLEDGSTGEIPTFEPVTLGDMVWTFEGFGEKSYKLQGEDLVFTGKWVATKVTNPEVPVDPTKPVDPSKPVTPTEPTKPVKPTKPTPAAKVEVASSQTVAQPVVKPIPRTSDESHLLMYVMLVMSSLMGVVVSVKRLFAK